MQRLMYNDMSELGQMVRGSNHKTLVKNRGVHEDTMPEKKPYLLQAIEMKVEMINWMAHLTPVRTYWSAVASGV